MVGFGLYAAFVGRGLIFLGGRTKEEGEEVKRRESGIVKSSQEWSRVVRIS